MECTPSPILWVNLIKEDGMRGVTFTKQKNLYRVLVGKLERNIQGKPKYRMIDTAKGRNTMGGPRLYKSGLG